MGVSGETIDLHRAEPDSKFYPLWQAPLVRGRWQRFVAHIRWGGSKRTGFVELWRNGEKVLPRTPLATVTRADVSSGPPLPNYLKIGLYRDPRIKFRQVIYHDNFRIGRSYEAVAP